MWTVGNIIISMPYGLQVVSCQHETIWALWYLINSTRQPIYVNDGYHVILSPKYTLLLIVPRTEIGTV